MLFRKSLISLASVGILCMTLSVNGIAQPASSPTPTSSISKISHGDKSYCPCCASNTCAHATYKGHPKHAPKNIASAANSNSDKSQGSSGKSHSSSDKSHGGTTGSHSKK